MNNLKEHQWFKVICSLLVVTFVAFDVAWAYPPGENAKNGNSPVL